jgi:hypothetical protein
MTVTFIWWWTVVVWWAAACGQADRREPTGARAAAPAAAVAPVRVFDAAAPRRLPTTDAFVLVEASKDPEDVYATFSGVRLIDLLAAAGVDVAAPGPTRVTVYAPDAYARTLDWADVTTPAEPTVVVNGLDVATLGPACGWVRYPEAPPEAPAAPWVLVAWARDGRPLEPGLFDAGGLRGEGPLRLVVPLRRSRAPDRGAKVSPTTCGDGRDFDPALPHNAQEMVRSVVALRVDPLPAGTVAPELSAFHGLLQTGGVAVFGAGVTAP